MSRRAQHPRRLLGPHRGAIVGALGIVENQHGAADRRQAENRAERNAGCEPKEFVFTAEKPDFNRERREGVRKIGGGFGRRTRARTFDFEQEGREEREDGWEKSILSADGADERGRIWRFSSFPIFLFKSS